MINTCATSIIKPPASINDHVRLRGCNNYSKEVGINIGVKLKIGGQYTPMHDALLSLLPQNLLDMCVTSFLLKFESQQIAT